MSYGAPHFQIIPENSEWEAILTQCYLALVRGNTASIKIGEFPNGAAAWLCLQTLEEEFRSAGSDEKWRLRKRFVVRLTAGNEHGPEFGGLITEYDDCWDAEEAATLFAFMSTQPKIILGTPASVFGAVTYDSFWVKYIQAYRQSAINRLVD